MDKTSISHVYKDDLFMPSPGRPFLLFLLDSISRFVSGRIPKISNKVRKFPKSEIALIICGGFPFLPFIPLHLQPGYP